MFWWLYVILGVVYWVFNLVAAIRTLRSIPRLADVTPVDRAQWPRVSHVIPACNEAAYVGVALQSRRGEGYPDAEFIVVNDRSTDDTPVLVDSLAAMDARLRVLHITELPAGWLGKVHALHRGTQLATGEWLLFSDADVHLEPGAIKKALTFCEQHNLEHLAVLPDIERGTRLLDVPMTMFLRLFCIFLRPRALADPQSRAAIGVGAFNLVRRSAFERTEGFEALRLDVVDDLALGQMLKQHGARGGVINGHKCVRVRWYDSVPDMARGAEKSALASFAGFSVLRLVALCMVLLALELAPFIGLFVVGRPTLQAVAGAGVLCALAAQLIPSSAFARPWWPVLFTPLASIISVAIMLRAGFLAVRRGGMLWRGTLYPTEMLRRGARLRFP